MKIIIPILGLIMFFACLPKKKSKSAIYFILLSGWVITFAYTFWRVTAVPLQKGWLSFAAGVILLAAECLSLLTFLTFQHLFTGTYRPVKKSLEVYQDKSLPFVDVLIVTYNEPLYLLEMTIAAAVNLHYPNDRFCVYVCDDGHRDELRKLCRKFNVRYVSREGNEHAKAGNINHALTIIQGDLFAVLDADMIVKPQFLQRTVGYFEDEQMAFVQTPQVYYNITLIRKFQMNRTFSCVIFKVPGLPKMPCSMSGQMRCSGAAASWKSTAIRLVPSPKIWRSAWSCRQEAIVRC